MVIGLSICVRSSGVYKLGFTKQSKTQNYVTVTLGWHESTHEDFRKFCTDSHKQNSIILLLFYVVYSRDK